MLKLFYRQIVLLPRWMNCLHGWFLITVFFELSFAKSWGQPARLPSEIIPIKRKFSVVICLWAPVFDLICMSWRAWMYFLQVFAISSEIVAVAIAMKRATMIHEIFIFCLFVLLVELNVSCWWRVHFLSVYILEFDSSATPSDMWNKNRGASDLQKWIVSTLYYLRDGISSHIEHL